jgi:hypothetical protein
MRPHSLDADSRVQMSFAAAADDLIPPSRPAKSLNFLAKHPVCGEIMPLAIAKTISGEVAEWSKAALC